MLTAIDADRIVKQHSEILKHERFFDLQGMVFMTSDFFDFEPHSTLLVLTNTILALQIVSAFQNVMPVIMRFIFAA